MLKNRPATLILVGVNVLFFGISYLQAGTLEYPQWLITQFEIGALFNPLVLEKEWYRIVAHMFLHGHFLHLAVNMYALYASGGELEEILGWKKFLIVYFLSGVGGAILSLYWNLFVIGVGASGAIFGLFGFTLVINIIVSRRDGLSILPLLMNFAIFVLINILFGEAFHADHAAHAGGFLTGAAIAATTYYTSRHFREIKLDLAFVLVLAILFFALPRFQVHYYRFMQ